MVERHPQPGTLRRASGRRQTVDQGHRHRLPDAAAESQQERGGGEQERVLQEREQHEHQPREADGVEQDLELAPALGHRRQRDADREHRGGEAADDDADQRGRQADRVPVDREIEQVEIPGHGNEPARDDGVAQLAVAQQVERAAFLPALLPADHGLRQQAPLHEQQDERDEGTDRQHQVRGLVAEVVDREAGDERSEEGRDRETDGKQRIVAGAVLGPAERAGDALDRHEEELERGSHDQRHGVERHHAGDEIRHQERRHHAERAGDHRHARADAIDQLADVERDQHRAQRPQRHHDADRERVHPEVQRVQRQRDLGAAEAGVDQHAAHDDQDHRHRQEGGGRAAASRGRRNGLNFTPNGIRPASGFRNMNFTIQRQDEVFSMKSYHTGISGQE